jgi:hypothetical protein
MGLNIALGRLQAAAGPDTRVTATADIIAGRHIDKKNWTGVWDTKSAAADKNIAWLVSGTAPQGATASTSALAAATGNTLIELVGDNTTDISATATTGNRVRVETQPITATGIPGTNPLVATTVGNFAYWVGDEGVKAKVTLTDPWENPSNATTTATSPNTTATQARAYSFIHAQRMGIEGIDLDDTNPPENRTSVGASYPAVNPTLGSNIRDSFKSALTKVIAWPQFALAHPIGAGQTALTNFQHTRFHDLTTSSYSLQSDVANGGLKKDLTAWIMNPAAPSNPVSGLPNDDYIFAGRSDDTGKYGLPKWGIIRTYANLQNTGSAFSPRLQTDTQQGIAPVMTYIRVGYNITCAAEGGPYKINIMPVLALWNPYNVPIAADPDGSFEVCFKYNSTVAGGNILKLTTYMPSGVTDNKTNNPDRDEFNLSSVSLKATNGSGLTRPYGIGTTPQFWRFKVILSRDLGPGESRIFTIRDSDDETEYVIGKSALSDADMAPNNAVYLNGLVPLNQNQMKGAKFWNKEYGSQQARMETILAVPVPTSATTATDVENFIRSNAYQYIMGYALDWVADPNPRTEIPPQNNGEAMVYDRFELLMSTMSDLYPESFGNTPSGTPRWLANLNPQAIKILRKPSSTGMNVTPSYVREFYTKNTVLNPSYVGNPLPNADGVNVSAGTRVSTSGSAQNLVIREIQPANTPLFSLAQLQHANVSLLSLNPTYAIGNSLPNLYIDVENSESALLPQDPFPGYPTQAFFPRIYDLSYHLNKALWDGYFFSTIPSSLTAAEVNNPNFRLPNARHRFHNTTTAPHLNELKSSQTAAAHLLVDGGFNVNSTSVQAWQALLYSHAWLATDPGDSAKKHPFSRFTMPPVGAQPNQTWLGYRVLSDNQIRVLAEGIVQQVRLRGPFLSLADFVNRRLSTDETGLKGLLQAVIDNTSGTNSINGVTPFTDNAMRVTNYPPDVTSTNQRNIYRGGSDTTHHSASRATFAPGYLTQADLLTSIGAVLTARSDTFIIRAYGNTINPMTGATEGQAWCEAVVQRLPEYVDSSTDPWNTPAAGSQNDRFGRRFQVISLRWLSPEDI